MPLKLFTLTRERGEERGASLLWAMIGVNLFSTLTSGVQLAGHQWKQIHAGMSISVYYLAFCAMTSRPMRRAKSTFAAITVVRMRTHCAKTSTRWCTKMVYHPNATKASQSQHLNYSNLVQKKANKKFQSRFSLPWRKSQVICGGTNFDNGSIKSQD